MNKNKEYAKNTLILLLGKFSTQFMSFLLIPLYTRCLNTSDYGAVDLIQSYISLFVPVLTLRFDSAVFRFLIDERKSKNSKKSDAIISNVIFTILFMAIVFSIIFSILGIWIKMKYYWLILLNIVVIMFSNILLQVSRGNGKNKEYSYASIITGLTTLIINLILILIFNYNASSILISSIFANLLCSIYLFIDNKLLNVLNIKDIDRTEIKKLLKYSIPMIPNALSWWIVNVSDRTIISFVLGTAVNGIYTISCKFSNILNSIFSIFNMSWQESASIHIDDEDRDSFFTNMVNDLFMLFTCFSLLIIAILPLLFNIIIGEKYILSYNYIPILMIANIFQILIQLFGGIYIAKKETKKIMNTTIVSAIINIIINVLLIKPLGLYAACLSTLVSYLSMCIYRYIDVQKYVKVKIELTIMFKVVLIFTLSSCLYYVNNIYLNIINFIIVILFSLIENKKMIKYGIQFIKKKMTELNSKFPF